MSEWLTKSYLQSVLRYHFKDDELVLQNIDISPGYLGGRHFGSRLYRIRNQYVRSGEPGHFSVIVKNVTDDTVFSSVSKNYLFYYNHEKFTLQYTLPKITEKINDSTLFFPKLYHADDEMNALFLEDLKEKNYETRTYPAGLDIEHCLLAVEAFAKFHAGSYLLLKDDSTLKVKYQTLAHQETYSQQKPMMAQAEKCIREILISLDLPEKFKGKLKNLVNWQEKLDEIREIKENGINAIIHDDVNRRNFMFQYVGDVVKDMKMIDFQMVTYNSIALDLVNFIYRNGDIYSQTTGVNKLLEYYHKTFIGITGELPGFNLELLKKEFQDKLFGGFLLVLTVYPLLAYPKKEEIDLAAFVNGKSIPWKKEMYDSPNFLQRIIELWPYFEENNVI